MPDYTVGAGILQAMKNAGDEPASDEIYGSSFALGKSGKVYAWSQAGGVKVFAPGDAPVPRPGWTPKIIRTTTPNHGGLRPSTEGVVIHSTRGNAGTVEREFSATINWFQSPNSQASTHTVIAWDGILAEVLDTDLVSWHAGDGGDGRFNARWVSVELVQPKRGDPISDEQYRTLAWWCIQMSKRYGFPLSKDTLREHKDIPPGVASGKSDVDAPFSVGRLLGEIARQG